MIAAALRKPAAELTRADARSYACVWAQLPPVRARGMTALYKAGGFATTMEYVALVSPHPALALSFLLCTGRLAG